MSKIPLKSKEEIAIMAEGGERLSSILREVLKKIKPGLTTLQINDWIDETITKTGGKASFKTVRNYHWASCVGVNDEVVHSIPTKGKTTKEGDLLKIDLGMLWQGWHTDLAWTIIVQNAYSEGIPRREQGKMQNVQGEFLRTGERALEKAIEVAVPGNRVGHISQKIEETIRKAGFSPVEILTGHGIGRRLHEEPLVPELVRGTIEETAELLPGMALAIEVIYNLGSPEVVLENDGWTVATKDGKISGLFERTIAITEANPLVLTGGTFVC